MNRSLLSAVLALGLFAAVPLAADAATVGAPCLVTCNMTILGNADVTANSTVPVDRNLNDGTGRAVGAVPLGVIGGAGEIPETRYLVIPIGGVAYGSLGTNTTPVAGTQYFSEISIPIDFTISSISCLNGTAAATDLLIYGLWNRTTGALLGNTALAGTLAAGTDAFQTISLTTPLAVDAGNYSVGYQTNGTTTRLRTIAASTYLQTWTHSDTGTFGTLETQTFPGTFTADKGPICYVTGVAQ
jgi:hypothetical protein